MVNQEKYPYLVDNYIQYINLIGSYRKSGILNMENESWVTPSKLLLLTNTIVEAKTNNRFICPKRENVNGYLDYITTESNLEMPHGSTNYIPFSRINDANVNSMASTITGLLGKKLKKESIVVLRYCIDELLTNVVEHSRYKNSFIMLQNYPSSNTLEFSIMDDGISIPGNFKEHGIYFKDDCDSLNKALSGISTKQEVGGRGFGLQSVFRVLTKGMKGEGVIISRRGILSSRFISDNQDPQKILYSYGENSSDITILKGCYIAFNVRNDLSPDLYTFL